MAMDLRFLAAGAKRVFDSRPMYSQVVVTDDCNLNCTYCTEYTPGAPIVPLQQLEERIDKLDELGVRVYDLLGGEPLLHPGLAELVRHIKSKRSNVVTVITNGFLLTDDKIRDLNDANLDSMEVSVDSIAPTATSPKSLKSVLPRLRLLAKEARFQVEVQTVLNEETYQTYEQFREMLKDFPFALGLSPMHAPGGQIAIRGEKFIDLLSKHGVFDGVNYYGEHLKEMLVGDFSRSWKCLAGFKYLYVNAKGEVQWCAQQRDYARPLEEVDYAELRRNNCHKPCESGCSQNCVRMVSQMLGEPLKMMGAGLRMALDLRKHSKAASSRTDS